VQSRKCSSARCKEFDEAKLAKCLDNLSERARSVLVLSFYADKSAAEVGRELGLRAENVRVIRYRALLSLDGIASSKSP
jgi:RNA polymerase sigma factor (sigma-70 family)